MRRQVIRPGLRRWPERPQARWRLGVHTDDAPKGLLITDVARNSPAFRFGLEPGDYLLEVRATGMLAPADDTAQAKRVWGALASVPAVRQGKIHVLSGEHLVVPGPRVVQGTEAFARALHPEAFK